MFRRAVRNVIEQYRTTGLLSLLKYVYGTRVSPSSLLQAKAYWYQLQGHPGVRETAKLLELSPELFTHRINTNWLDRPFPKEYSIRGGDWDERSAPFEEDPKYKYIVRYHERGEPADRMAVLPEWKKSRSHRIGFEKLYESIQEDGYRTQRELESSGTIFDEINVCIGRDGKLIIKHGHHRASIAKVLGLETVPVYVRARHRQWQQLRDQIWAAETAQTLSDREREQLSHPDIQTAFRNSQRRGHSVSKPLTE